MMAEDIPLSIVYEDDAVLIINKGRTCQRFRLENIRQRVLPMRFYLIMISGTLQVQCTL